MEEKTRRYGIPAAEEEPVRLDEVLEPYNAQAQQTYQISPEEYPSAPVYEEEEPSGAYTAQGDYEDDYSDDHEELDRGNRVRTAMNIFNTFSVLGGVVVILVLLAMVFSLYSWLRNDILHSLTLLQGGIQ